MKITKNAFSFVEIIISISIIIILWVVAITNYTSFQDKSQNSKVSADIQSIDNSLVSFLQEEQNLPMPKWNLKFYTADTTYAHNYEDDETFWVSWYITEDTIPKKYLNFLPLDPRTNNYYAYWKTKSSTWFEISWVSAKNNEYTSIVYGSWNAENWPFSLIREYLWPQFVVNNSKQYFPYNPEERVLTAKINSFSWVVKINGKQYSFEETTNYTLWKWDKVLVWALWFANIYYSDGSYSTLWDSETSSELVFANMEYPEENNLFTSVKLALNVWSIWTKAAKLDEKSEFNIYTTDSVAAVRWTIFWVRKTSSITNIIVLEWKVEVQRLNNWQNIVEDLFNWKEVVWSVISWDKLVITIDNQKSYINVNKGESIKWIEIKTGGNPSSSTWAIDKIPAELKSNIIENISYINQNLVPEIKSFNQEDATNFELVLKMNSSFALADYLKLETSTWENYKFSGITNSDVLTLTWWTNFESRKLSDIKDRSPKIKLSFCDKIWEKEICSKELEIDFANIALNFKNIDEKVIFWWEIVENTLYDEWYDLVAYAGYNNNLKLWTWSSNNIEGSFEFLKDYDTSNNRDIYYKYNSSENKFLDWDYSNTNNRRSSDLSNSGLPNFVKKIGWEYAIYEWWNYWTWILIENDNYNSWRDFLKYEIWDLKLTSWNWFAIEMSVRGASLKNRNSNYYLFDFLNSSWSWISLRLTQDNNNGQYLSLLQNNITWIVKISNFWDLENDKFYKIIAKFENNNWYLDILDWNDIIIYGIPSQYIIPSLTYLYIWAEKYEENWKLKYKNQWNDIIDYVKIYRK